MTVIGSVAVPFFKCEASTVIIKQLILWHTFKNVSLLWVKGLKAHCLLFYI